MDATHDTAGYGYQLANILVTDSFGNGIATEFCLPSGSSKEEWGTFLSVIKTELEVFVAELSYHIIQINQIRWRKIDLNN